MRKVLFIFSVLSDGDVEWLGKAGQRVNVEPGTVLIPVGARVEYVHFVLDGRLAIKTKAGDTIAQLESGEIIGEMSLVDPAPTSVSVEVVADSTLLRIANSTLRDKLAAVLYCDTTGAMSEYLSWEVDLVERIKRDGTCHFST